MTQVRYRLALIFAVVFTLGFMTGCTHHEGPTTATIERKPEVAEEGVPPGAQVEPEVPFTPREGEWANYALRQTARIGVYNQWARSENTKNGYVDVPPVQPAPVVVTPKTKIEADPPPPETPAPKASKPKVAKVDVKVTTPVVTADVKVKAEKPKADKPKCEKCENGVCETKVAPRVIMDIAPAHPARMRLTKPPAHPIIDECPPNQPHELPPKPTGDTTVPAPLATFSPVPADASPVALRK